jgi:hypothetical protein
MQVICIVCGGEHESHPAVCDPKGMERQIAKLGARTWNRLTRPRMTDDLREFIRQQSRR